jgi:hypothetical protein
MLHEEVWNGFQKLNSGFGSICTLTQSNMLNMLIRSLEEKMLPRWDPVSVIDVLLDNRGKLWILTEAQIFIIDKGVKKVVFNCGKRFGRKAKFLGIKANNQGSHVYVFHQNFLKKPIYNFTEF